MNELITKTRVFDAGDEGYESGSRANYAAMQQIGHGGRSKPKKKTATVPSS